MRVVRPIIIFFPPRLSTRLYVRELQIINNNNNGKSGEIIIGQQIPVKMKINMSIILLLRHTT